MYFKKNRVHLELYTDRKDLETDAIVEDVLDAHDVYYEKSETWIPDEKMYEVLFSFETEDEEDEQDEQGQ